MAMLRDKGAPLPEVGTYCIHHEPLQSKTLDYATKALGICAYHTQLNCGLDCRLIYGLWPTKRGLIDASRSLSLELPIHI